MKDLGQLMTNLKGHTIIEGGRPEDDGVAVQLHYGPLRNALRVIASWGAGWDHVSVSKQKRCPTWEEMCFVKDFFFKLDECVVQYHPAETNYINNHPFCLHLWRPQEGVLPMPPEQCV